MRVRRLLLVASMVVLLWAAPASAQSYGDIFGEGETTTEVFEASESEAIPAGDLARTGQSNIAPMVQVALVLLGAGALLVVVARRRHTNGLAA